MALANPLSESGLELREIAGKVKIMGGISTYICLVKSSKVDFEK